MTKRKIECIIVGLENLTCVSTVPILNFFHDVFTKIIQKNNLSKPRIYIKVLHDPIFQGPDWTDKKIRTITKPN